MENRPERFSEQFGNFVYRSAYTPGQLATLSGVPKTTIINWLKGRVERPRNWERIVALAAAMRLTQAETDLLLTAANHPSLRELEQTSGFDAKALFNFWQPSISQPPTPFQAIPLLPTFVGRSEQLTKLEALLKKPSHPQLYGLFGMAGVGKTSIAAQLAYQLRDHFADGVLWARLDSSNTMSILATFAQAYGQDVSQLHNLDGRSRIVRDLMQNKHALIVLDNAETTEQIEPLLPPTGRCAVLITTRRKDLSVLVGAKRIEIRPFSADSHAALDLFGKILGPERTEANARKLTEIAHDLGYLPLALTIAASRLAIEPGWRISTFASQLRHTERPLSTLEFDTQNVHKSFELTTDHLKEDERQLLAAAGRLGPHPFAPESVAAVANTTQSAAAAGLRHLHSLSLIQLAVNDRFQLHPLLREFAQTLVGPANWDAKLVSFWHTFIFEFGDEFAAVEKNLGPIEHALQLAGQTNQLQQMSQMVDRLSPLFITWGLHSRIADLLSQIRALLESNGQPIQSWLFLREGQLARHQQRFDEAEERLAAGLILAEKQEDSGKIGQFLMELGIIRCCTDQLDDGEALLLKALPLVEESSPDSSLLTLLEELGILEIMRDHRERAAHYYQLGYEKALAHGKIGPQILFLKSQGALHHLNEERSKAEALFSTGYSLSEKIGYLKGLMLLGNNLAVMDYYSGRIEQAEAGLIAALERATQLHDAQATRLILMNLAGWAEHTGQLAQSRIYLERLLKLAAENEWSQFEPIIKGRLNELDVRSSPNRLAHLRVFI